MSDYPYPFKLKRDWTDEALVLKYGEIKFNQGFSVALDDSSLGDKQVCYLEQQIFLREIFKRMKKS